MLFRSLYSAFVLFTMLAGALVLEGNAEPDMKIGTAKELEAFLLSNNRYALVTDCVIHDTGEALVRILGGLDVLTSWIDFLNLDDVAMSRLFLLEFDGVYILYRHGNMDVIELSPKGLLITKDSGETKGSPEVYLNFFAEAMGIDSAQLCYAIVRPGGLSHAARLSFVIIPGATAVASLALILYRTTRLARSRSSLGRRINEHGSFYELETVINNQLLSPVAESHNFIATEDFVFLFSDGIIKEVLCTREVFRCELAAVELYGDELRYLLSFDAGGKTYSVKTFDHDEGKKAAEHINAIAGLK